LNWNISGYKQAKKIIKNSLPLLVRMRSPFHLLKDITSNGPTHTLLTQTRNRRPHPAPCFFMFPISRTTSRKDMRERSGSHRSDGNSHGAILSRLVNLSAGNCQGAEPTFNPALLPAADNLPAFARGGPPSHRHSNTPLSIPQKNRLRLSTK